MPCIACTHHTRHTPTCRTRLFHIRRNGDATTDNGTAIERDDAVKLAKVFLPRAIARARRSSSRFLLRSSSRKFARYHPRISIISNRVGKRPPPAEGRSHWRDYRDTSTWHDRCRRRVSSLALAKIIKWIIVPFDDRHDEFARANNAYRSTDRQRISHCGEKKGGGNKRSVANRRGARVRALIYGRMRE